GAFVVDDEDSSPRVRPRSVGRALRGAGRVLLGVRLRGVGLRDVGLVAPLVGGALSGALGRAGGALERARWIGGAGRAPGAAGRRGELRGVEGQAHDEARAVGLLSAHVDGALDGDGAAGALDDLATDGQPQPRARVALRREEGEPDAIDELWSDPRARVRDGDLHVGLAAPGG